MTETYRPEAGEWWRFDKYEIRDGLIRPAAGATLREYDPWDAYEESRRRGAGSDAEPPYQSLFRLATTATLDTRGSLTPDSERALLAWCSRFGLLGIILQHCTVLPAGQWIPDREIDTPEEQAMVDALKDRAHVWQRGHWTRQGAPAEAPRYTDGFSRYFPNIEDPGNPANGVPTPETPVFWREYAEPVTEFLGQANQLRRVLESLLAINPAQQLTAANEVGWASDEELVAAGDGNPSDLDLGQIELAFLAQCAEDALNEYTSTVAPVLAIGLDLQYHMNWRFRSLVASFAMMVLQDLTEGRRARRCGNDACRTLFLSNRKEAAYCSLKCRNTAQKRRQRKKVSREHPQAG